MNNNERTKKLINLGGLVRLSGLDLKINDPATLLGLLIDLSNKVDDLKVSDLNKKRDIGFQKMKFSKDLKSNNIVSEKQSNFDEDEIDEDDIF